MGKLPKFHGKDKEDIETFIARVMEMSRQHNESLTPELLNHLMIRKIGEFLQDSAIKWWNELSHRPASIEEAVRLLNQRYGVRVHSMDLGTTLNNMKQGARRVDDYIDAFKGVSPFFSTHRWVRFTH